MEKDKPLKIMGAALAVIVILMNIRFLNHHNVSAAATIISSIMTGIFIYIVWMQSEKHWNRTEKESSR